MWHKKCLSVCIEPHSVQCASHRSLFICFRLFMQSAKCNDKKKRENEKIGSWDSDSCTKMMWQNQLVRCSASRRMWMRRSITSEKPEWENLWIERMLSHMLMTDEWYWQWWNNQQCDYLQQNIVFLLRTRAETMNCTCDSKWLQIPVCHQSSDEIISIHRMKEAYSLPTGSGRCVSYYCVILNQKRKKCKEALNL